MENYYLVDMLIATRAIEFIVLFNRQAAIKDIKLYGLKIGSLIYLVI